MYGKVVIDYDRVCDRLDALEKELKELLRKVEVLMAGHYLSKEDE